MDMRMPALDGHAATKNIRALETETSNVATGKLQNHTDDSQQSTIIIALTAGAFEEQRAEALASGCDDFVRKPLDEEDIFEKMQKYLKLRYIYEAETLPQAGKYVKENQRFEEEGDWTPEEISKIPTNLLTTLEEAVEMADMEIIHSVIADIRAYHVPVANTLARLTKGFHYEKVLVVLQHIQKKRKAC
jgi:DNA-binding response OmpR family regulator